MKKLFKYILIVFLCTWGISGIQAQDNRTLTTKVADILARFPADDVKYSDLLVQQIIDLGEAGITGFCNMIVPPGTGDDTQARFAIESLAVYSGAPNREQARELVTETLLKAIDKASDKEVKSFFIRRLKFCGKDECVAPLSELLNDGKVSGPAVAVLTSIGTKKAASAMLTALDGAAGTTQTELIKALGILKYKPAVPALTTLTASQGETKKQALNALSKIGDTQAATTFTNAAKAVGYKPDESKTMLSFLQYVNRLAENGDKKTAKKLCTDVLKNCKSQEQMIFRSSVIRTLRTYWDNETISLLLKEIKNPDKAYRAAVLNVASEGMTRTEAEKWIAAMKKAPAETKVQIISAIAKRNEPAVLSECILPSLNDASLEVRIEAINAFALNQKGKAVPVLLKQLEKTSQKEELGAIKTALLQTCTTEDCPQLAEELNQSKGQKAVLILEVMAARRATGYFSKALNLCFSEDKELKAAAFRGLKTMVAPENLGELITLLKKISEKTEIEETQQAVITLLQTGKAEQNLVLQQMNTSGMKVKLLPVLPFLNNPEAFSIVTTTIGNGNGEEKQAAYGALLNWKNTDAIPYLYSVIEDGRFATSREKTFNTYLQQVSESDFPDDQKLLLVRKLLPVCQSDQEKLQLIQSARTIKTFLSLVFVSDFLDDEELSTAAALAAMKIMLPTPGEDNGLQGTFVRSVAEKVVEKISGADSQYYKIDIREFLEKMPEGEGFVPIFNGKDLSGWQGLVGNPVSRAEMSPEKLEREQVIADKKMNKIWFAKDGCICFNGEGVESDNLCTKRGYRDFEMLVDWKIDKNGDSGIYLRGAPQVQIWDISRVNAGAQVGSGGLYNNKISRSTPLVVVDNPVGDWNTFRIKMVGDKVTVYLNGVLVTDNVTMENYWDRNIPIFPEGSIELQAHGTNIAFRNLFVKEISNHVLLSYKDTYEPEKPVKTLDEWSKKRSQILSGMQQAMGELPSRANLPPLDIQVTDSLTETNYIRFNINFMVADGERITAYLYIPSPRSTINKFPAMMVLHGTGVPGKDLADTYSRELVQRGYVVIAPDYPSFGGLINYDFDKDRYMSGTMKGIFDHMRCVDLLQARKDVDPERIGVIGHSLGGHNAIFVGAFDTRLKVVVSSCGWTLMNYYDLGPLASLKFGGKLGPWAQKRYMPLIRDKYDLDTKKIPFDFDEVIAAIAPRAFFSNSPLNDKNFDVNGVRLGMANISEVYHFFKAENKLHAYFPDDSHNFSIEARRRAYLFVDKIFKPDSKIND